MNERLRVEVKFKNATLYNALRDRFPPSNPRYQKHADLMAASALIGVSYTVIHGYLNLTRSPWQADGEPRASAEKISAYMQITCDELFPLRLYSGIIPKGLSAEIDGGRYISLQEARQAHLLPRSTEEIEAISLRDYGASNIIDKVLNTLTPREESVIRMRFGLDGGGERTLEEVGQSFAVTRERIRVTEAKALAKLRGPSRARCLRPILP